MPGNISTSHKQAHEWCFLPEDNRSHTPIWILKTALLKCSWVTRPKFGYSEVSTAEPDCSVPYHSELFIELHLLSQHSDIVEKMRLHVTPHVREPPELFPVFEQHIIPFIFLICTYREQKRKCKNKRQRGAQCFKAVANTLQYWVIPTENHAHSNVLHTHEHEGCTEVMEGRVPGAYQYGRIFLRSPSWRWNLGLKFSAYSGCSVEPVWMKGREMLIFRCSVTFLSALLVRSSVWRGITEDGAKALLPV